MAKKKQKKLTAKDLAKMSDEKLVKAALAAGVEVKEDMKRADIEAALLATQEASGKKGKPVTSKDVPTKGGKKPEEKAADERPEAKLTGKTVRLQYMSTGSVTYAGRTWRGRKTATVPIEEARQLLSRFRPRFAILS